MLPNIQLISETIIKNLLKKLTWSTTSFIILQVLISSVHIDYNQTRKWGQNSL